MHVAEKHVKDVRPHSGYQFMGHQGYGLARQWAEGVKDVMRELGCAGEPLAVDKLDGNGFRALVRPWRRASRIRRPPPSTRAR